MRRKAPESQDFSSYVIGQERKHDLLREGFFSFFLQDPRIKADGMEGNECQCFPPAPLRLLAASGGPSGLAPLDLLGCV